MYTREWFESVAFTDSSDLLTSCVYLLSLYHQALALTPMILFKSRKFAALFTFGSVFTLGR